MDRRYRDAFRSFRFRLSFWAHENKKLLVTSLANGAKVLAAIYLGCVPGPGRPSSPGLVTESAPFAGGP